jgi:hypothetical protein
MSHPCSRWLGSSYLPLYAHYADLLARLLIVVEPFAIRQVYAGELGARVCSCSLEVSLDTISLRPSAIQVLSKPTSALNSVNSSPLQSNSSMFTVFGGSVCSYVAGGAFTFAECSLCYVSIGVGRARDGQSDLTVLAPPYEICFALAATHVILLKAIYCDKVWMYLAT